MTRNVLVLAAVLLAGSVLGQAQTPVTPLDKLLERVDLGVSGAAELTGQVSGNVIPPNAPNAGTVVSDKPSNTVGALATLRYVAKPYVGFEFNFVYARYTENFSYPPPALGVQTGADEYTLGYLVTPGRTLFGLQPFASAGLGTMRFKPTPRGGQGLNTQARAAYYYSLGVQKEVFAHVGLRASFRQVFYLDPDFGQNYFTVKQHTVTSEPTIGFFLRF